MSAVPPVTPAPSTPTESRLAALEAKLKADESSLATWIKANWPHFVTWLAGAWLIVKHLL
jgi:hypothetical protein